MDVKDLFKDIESYEGKSVTLEGWVRNNRSQVSFGFIDFNDGTYFKNLQLVYDNTLKDFDEISKIRVGCAIKVTGTIVKSEGKGQSHELKVSSIVLLGDCPENYPIQPKKHTREFLREMAYLRPRTNLYNAIFRVRSVAAQAIHEYFAKNNYIYFNSPIITGADCEGSGQMFEITTLDLDNLPKTSEGKISGGNSKMATYDEMLEAMQELQSIISDMDKTIKTKFKENFDQVVVNFEEIFKELFGGGHAELTLDNEDNPLESGIDIIAQPPGKKLQNINLMSGGEKTMTAIALMFAVLKTKPTPFCILDEVEAALDDNNIDRFARYLRRFDGIQFAIVTHQKATMEHADVLYGVTMPEQGISKVLSLRLGDDFDI